MTGSILISTGFHFVPTRYSSLPNVIFVFGRAARWCIFQPDFANLVSFESRFPTFFNLV